MIPPPVDKALGASGLIDAADPSAGTDWVVPGLGLKVKLLFFQLRAAAAAALHSGNTLNKRGAFRASRWTVLT